MKGWAKMLSPKPGPQRRKMMKKCGSRCFLRPRNLGYPICVRNTCKQSRKGLLAAVARGKQNHDEYVVNKAKRLLKSHKKRSSMINNRDVLTDEEIRIRIVGMNGISDGNIRTAIRLWRKIYEFSVGAGAGSRELPENVSMRDVFGSETDKIIRILADADLINEMDDKNESSIINIALALINTLMLFNDNPNEEPKQNNPLMKVYVDRYYNELARRREAGIEPVRIELFEVEGVGRQVTDQGLACNPDGCRNRNGVCVCRLLDPPTGRVFGKCDPENCNITYWMDLMKHKLARVY